MPTVTITKTAYTKLVDTAVEGFTAQCRAETLWEVTFAETEPAVETAGALVPPGLEHGITRANGTGHGWGKLPASAPVATAAVVVI